MTEQTPPIEPQYYEFYNAEGYPEEPKRIFVAVADRIEAAGLTTGKRFLDVGCANGAFTAYLKSRFPGNEFVGVDIFDEMLDEARLNMPDATFDNVSVLDMPEAYFGQFDVVTCVGVLMIFDDQTLPTAIKNLIRCSAPGGKIFALSIFNADGVDTITKWRHWTDGRPGDWTIDRNILSLQTLDEILKPTGHSYRIEPYDIDIDLPRTSDPRRAYTVQLGENPRQLVSGLSQLLQMYLVEIVA